MVQRSRKDKISAGLTSAGEQILPASAQIFKVALSPIQQLNDEPAALRQADHKHEKWPFMSGWR